MKNVFVFLDPKQNQTQIMQAVKGFGGIYIWTNLHNGKKSVGSSINLRKQLYSYFETNNKDTKVVSIIFNALQKYSHNSFFINCNFNP